ncbi:MAG: hypothetical protein ACI8UO_005493 [Verrucomicrobiales bacterium]|jgi:hypothetical protein
MLETHRSVPDNAAQFRKVALQVNSYAYLINHGNPGREDFKDEADFNAQMVSALKNERLEMIAVTDHLKGVLGQLKRFTIMNTIGKTLTYRRCELHSV